MQNYRPINCEFHDLLEACATRRQPVLIVTNGADGARRSFCAVIVDLYSRNGAEFLTIDSGENFRLDTLLSVNGVDCSAAQ